MARRLPLRYGSIDLGGMLVDRARTGLGCGGYP